VAYAELASAFNNVGVTVADDPAPGDLDGGGSSFLAGRLAQEGLTPGATFDANGFTFTWPDSSPGTPDNVAGQGQTIATPDLERGNALAFLGTGTSAAADGTATVHYADGSTAEATLGFPNWCCLPTDRYGARIAVTTHGKNTPDGPAYPTVAYHLFTNTLRVDPDKQVAAVTLPANSAVHVFGLTVGDEEVVPPPVEDGQYTLSNLASGQLLTAPGDTNGAQLGTAEPSTAPTQKWTLDRHADGSYQVRNAASGLCVDVAGSAQASGAQVVQYTCTGTSNQRWVISDDDGRLALAAQHSGLSLTARPDGLVVQADDTGSSAQRWGTAAS
jgi:alpha-glucosidase